ncbi:MAG: HAD family hydrolase [Deltaproteobacteria bacterium]|nr:HAD family hydrolase [Deltaproteobacteria bacterium]
MIPINTVIFDLGNVLIDWDPRYLYRKLFNTDDEVEWFLENICDQDWNLKHDSGQLFSQGIFEKSKNFPEHIELIKAWYQRWEEMLGGPIDESVKILSELKEKRVLLYILSNWSAETYPIAEERFDFLSWFDGKIISGEVGIVKPDLEIYKLLIKRYGLNPQKTVFIDDKDENIKAAKLVGIYGIQFQNASKLRKDLQMLKLI